MGISDFIKKGLGKISGMMVTDDVAEPVIVMAAWISASDGKVEQSEIAETEKFIQESEYFKGLDKDKLSKSYRKWCDKFVKEPQDAIVYGLMEIHPMIKKPEGKAALSLALRIASADGNYSENEQKVIKRACHYLGIDLSEL